MKKFSLANEEELFVKKETTEGTLVYPVASDKVLAVGAATTNQDGEFLDDAQVRPRRSRATPIRGRTNAGAWSFNTYVKPSGVLGTKPEADVLLECGMGKKTGGGASPIVYALDSTSNLPSFSLWRKVGHTVFSAAGATVNVADFSIAGNEIAQIAWSGEFMKWYYAGTAYLTGIAAPGDNHVHVNDATRFSGAGKIKVTVGADTNGGLGYLVTGIDYVTNTLTVSPVLSAGAASLSAVAGWYPTSGTEVGQPVHGKLGLVTIDSTPAVVLSGKITLTNNIKYYTDEKNNQMYPTIYGAPGFRDVTGSIQLYFYRNTSSYWYRSNSQIQDALILPAGNVPGRIMELSCPRIEYKTPTISGDTETMVELPFTAVASPAGDDEFTVTFK
jgi:hypothetical protein